MGVFTFIGVLLLEDGRGDDLVFFVDRCSYGDGTLRSNFGDVSCKNQAVLLSVLTQLRYFCVYYL